jgi:7-alpha-hydroxysteroid dehydrogenase
MQGHSAIVTGGAQNIGEAIARSFAGAGARVMIADLIGDKASATAEQIAKETGSEVKRTRNASARRASCTSRLCGSNSRL